MISQRAAHPGFAERGIAERYEAITRRHPALPGSIPFSSAWRRLPKASILGDRLMPDLSPWRLRAVERPSLCDPIPAPNRSLDPFRLAFSRERRRPVSPPRRSRRWWWSHLASPRRAPTSRRTRRGQTLAPAFRVLRGLVARRSPTSRTRGRATQRRSDWRNASARLMDISWRSCACTEESLHRWKVVGSPASVPSSA